MIIILNKIQIIQHIDSENSFEGENITVSSIDEPISFDNFDINIIDLSCSKLWFGNTEYNVWDEDFNILRNQINDSKGIVIILCPQNIEFSFFTNNRVTQTKYLQYLTDILFNIIYKLTSYNVFFKYGQNFKLINSNKFKADFYFNEGYDSILYSDKSKKSLAILINDKIILTTLDLSNSNELIDFLREINLIEDNKSEKPYWFKDIQWFNDLEQSNIINDQLSIISSAENQIKNSKNILDKNNYYKSILYTNSDELVEVVFKILEELLDCDLSDFIDVKKEDFLIKFDDNSVLIGEIKGVTSNVRSEHVAQLDIHYQNYLDNSNSNENVKSTLIINYERKKEPKDRTPIHNIQIDLAKRNGSLIIDTFSLLKIYEKFLLNEITSKQIKEYIFNNSGLVSLDSI